jgi:hypothetical protein
MATNKPSITLLEYGETIFGKLLRDPAFVTEIPVSLGCIPILATSSSIINSSYSNLSFNPLNGNVLAEMFISISKWFCIMLNHHFCRFFIRPVFPHPSHASTTQNHHFPYRMGPPSYKWVYKPL